MCVTVHQIIGYAVPSKKITLAKKSIDKYQEIFAEFHTWNLHDIQTIYIITRSSSFCECGDENGDGREFIRDTFKILSYDEDDMELTKDIKDNILSKLKQVGLDKHAVFGVYTDADIDNH